MTSSSTHSASPLEDIQSKETLKDLIVLWNSRNKSNWKKFPYLYLSLGLRLKKLQEYIFAYDVLSEGMELLDHTGASCDLDVQKLIHAYTLVLLELDLPEQALSSLKQYSSYLDEEHSEIQGLKGRVYKDLADSEDQKERRYRLQRKSYAVYVEAFHSASHRFEAGAANSKERNQAADDAYYNGINAATMALLSGDNEDARTIAKTTFDYCRYSLQNTPVEYQYWCCATMGEALLIQNDLDSALNYYNQALEKEHDSRAKASTYRQALRIANKNGINDSMIHVLFKTEHVIAVIDNDPFRQIKQSEEATIKDALRRWIREHPPIRVFSGATSDYELMFLEVLQEEGCEHVNCTAFSPYSIDSLFYQELNNQERWEKASELCTLHALGQYDEHIEVFNYEFLQLQVFGQGKSMAERALCQFTPLLLSSGEDSQNAWRKNQLIYEILKLPSTAASAPKQELATGSRIVKNLERVSYEPYLYYLFTDAMGYSQLTDPQLALFSQYFMGSMSEITRKYDKDIRFKRTMGDALFLVLDDVEMAVHCALELCDQIRQTDWGKYDLPSDLKVRISLDCGPSYECRDLVFDNSEASEVRMDYCGSYVIRAARLEPVTPAGEVYATETFTSLLQAKNVNSVTASYKGKIKLPKNYGNIPAYKIHWVKNSRLT